MDHGKRQRLTGQVKRFWRRFAQGAGADLGRVIPEHRLMQWIKEEAGDYRERNPVTSSRQNSSYNGRRVMKKA